MLAFTSEWELFVPLVLQKQAYELSMQASSLLLKSDKD